MARAVATHLMFTGRAAEALDLYSSVFPSFQVRRLERYGDDDGGPPGTVKIAEVSFSGHDLIVIDSPPVHDFTFTPSVSLFVTCESADELDGAFATLADGGAVFMPLGSYGFSARFGWCADRFGVSWQLNLP